MSKKPETGPNIKRLAKIIADATEDHITELTRDHEEEARWWAAYRIAESMCESYKASDWADMIQHGYPPLTDEDVKDLISPESEDEKEYTPTREEIRRWFGLK